MSTPLIPPGAPAVGHNAAPLLAEHQHVTVCDFQARSDRDVGGGVLADSVVEA